LVIVGDKAIIMKTGETISFLTISAYELWYAINRDAQNRKEKCLSAGYWLQSKNRRQYEGLYSHQTANWCLGYYNLWRGFAVIRTG